METNQPTIVALRNRVGASDGKREEPHAGISMATETQKQERFAHLPLSRQAKQTTPLHGNTSDLLTLEVLKSFGLISLKFVENMVFFVF